MTLSPTPPSPVLPGAYPSSLHRRSATCPTPRPPIDPLHLERVLEFQQRLVSQMNESDLPSTASFAASPSADSALTPADSLESNLTRFRTDTSTSIATDTSVSTSYTSRSSPERLVTAKLPPFAFKTKYPALENNYPTRIPRPTNAVRCTPDQTRARSQGERQNVFSAESPSPTSRLLDISTSSSFSLGRASNSSPVSPMIFASPTSSAFPRFTPNSQPSPHDCSSSYEYNSSPSWETSYGSEYNDRLMLNPSPSPSPMSGRSNLAPRTLSAANRTPSIEISSAVPMLTSLSLPASPDTSMSVEPEPIVSRSPRLSPINGDTSPWSFSLSPASPVLSVVPDLSLSPDGHVVSFPSPSLSSSPFASPLPSPVLDGASELEYVGDTSAAEYAAAIMSSAWASDGPSMSQVIPQGLLPTESPVEIDTAPDPDPRADASTVEEEETPEPLAYLENVQYLPTRRQEAKTGGVLGKMKKLSNKFRMMLRGKSKAVNDNGGVNIDVDVRRVGGTGNSPLPDGLLDVIDIQSSSSAAQVYNSLLPSHCTDSHLPLPLPPPPGLLVRKPKTRPILSSQTYNSTLARIRTNDTGGGPNPPAIHIRPPTSSGHVVSNDIPPKTPSPDLTSHLRPKTLAEIKSKRRLSLSALSNFARSSSPAPPVNIVTHRRTRPASALAFYPRPPPISSFRAQTDGNVSVYRRPELPASMSSRTTSTAAVSGTIRSDSIPAPTSMALPRDTQLSADAIKKKNRRFSLSALSNFAAGHWDEGSWQRNGGLRIPPEP
ncbi:hypothetical protein C8R43DRAFT_1229513 [Mycena crocata]|nr:hypothetical protein C8R43DRAFT_1229513 [Mycena crocata]